MIMYKLFNSIMFAFTFGKIDKELMDKLNVALQAMVKGMLGIFLALTVVFVFTILLTKIFPKDKEEDTQE